MASLGMEGPYDMTSEQIDANITKTSPGNYALGYTKNGIFKVQYVDRADSDVASRLKDHLDEEYEKFKFCYASSPTDAYLRECKNFHDFGGSLKLHNKIHPAKPADSKWKCPVCDE